MEFHYQTMTNNIVIDLAVLLTLNNREIPRITGCYLIRVNIDY